MGDFFCGANNFSNLFSFSLNLNLEGVELGVEAVDGGGELVAGEAQGGKVGKNGETFGFAFGGAFGEGGVRSGEIVKDWLEGEEGGGIGLEEGEEGGGGLGLEAEETVVLEGDTYITCSAGRGHGK